MNDCGYWIMISAGWDKRRPKGSRWDATVVSVVPTEEGEVPDVKALCEARPDRVITVSLWAPQTGWTLSRQEGPIGLIERFAVVPFYEKGPYMAAVRLAVGMAMRLAVGLSDCDRDPFPAPGVN